MKLWQKEISTHEKTDAFTVGKDREFDLRMAEADVLGSMAHAEMLSQCGMLTRMEKEAIHEALKEILESIHRDEFVISPHCEDIHSQVELLLTEKTGEAGKKIHTARSRNDQSLLDIKLFCRKSLQQTVDQLTKLFFVLQELSEKHRADLLPGYTHLQMAMPSSFGLWFGAYAESLCDDLELLHTAYRLADKNPLGSAAGYGSSFPVNRELVTELLGFSGMHVNSVYAQMSRGKTEKTIALALAGIAATLAKLAMDCTLFLNQHFGFISFPEAFTTGSSIMPHKKNPDVWELIRGKCNRLQALPNEFSLLLGNLPSGYHRELQLTKEMLFPAFDELHSALEMAEFMLRETRVKENILDDAQYDLLFTVDAVNELVKAGIPFRDAYRKVGKAVEEGIFVKPEKLEHTHTGSIGNPGNDVISARFEKIKNDFDFERVENALRKLST